MDDLGHNLIPCDNPIEKNWPDMYLAYSCLKCNKLIFFSIYWQKYWSFHNQIDVNFNPISWEYLELTCNEVLIKTLLE